MLVLQIALGIVLGVILLSLLPVLGMILGALVAQAPELNPVECIWGYLKHHAMPNYCGHNLRDVADSRPRQLAPDATALHFGCSILEAGGTVLTGVTYARLNNSRARRRCRAL